MSPIIETQYAKRLLFICFCFVALQVRAQDNRGSDELFQDARKAAFDRKDYPAAIALSKQALAQSPDYSDIRVFLGRVYTWSDQLDSARAAFQYVIKAHPEYEDAYVGIADLEYWNDRPAEALRYAETGLQYNPKSEELLLRKAKALLNLKRLQDAALVANQILEINPKNAQARAVLINIKDQVRKNKLEIGYDYTYFDKRFDQPWHLGTIAYSRQTKYGSVTGRVNYANKFGEGGWQGEIDAYPRISNTFYAYTSVGYSNSDIFPQYRAGFSLYANLPKSFEGEVGFRYLYFSDPTWVYTASIGKYYKSFWFNFRTFLTPGEGNLSKSFQLTSRYYTAGADDFIALGIGTGISPDDQRNNINYHINTNLMTYKAMAEYRHTIWKQIILGAGITYYYEEYQPSTYGNQINFSIFLQKRF
ncbi:YaiO family outer membrane protein [Chitinophaga skermanii]|uniref:YaiO family outer membrane protein n=1 Tax=Chitinophaga skermanii TaxID=331697 RepID=A0A327PZA2_9BACT|nr:YaiO family outer membrane beta-barrel protein [Chitinophaga skermanii]RAI97570.1 YaiO family outer membrane protein [Chitinophaga skermanii]